MSQAIIIRKYGAPDVLQIEDIEVGAPEYGELRIRQTRIGVNFHDTYVRSGYYQTLSLPGVPGCEGVGVVEAIGSGVEGFSIGDRIAYVSNTYGCYATERTLPAKLAVKLPNFIDDTLAASVFMKGLTVEILVNRVASLKSKDWILVHAAAGGVGQLLVQWAVKLGVKVIGTVGSDEKVEVARKVGCSEVILYSKENTAKLVHEITGGKGVDIVYDSVGKDTLLSSIDSLATFGHIVSFGQSSGNPEPLLLAQLAKRSNTLSRPMLPHYLHNNTVLQEISHSLFSMLEVEGLKSEKPLSFPLYAAYKAHKVLESRQSVQPIILDTSQ